MAPVKLVYSSFLCAGNLYSREVQVDGDPVTIQVQDTPGAEVRSAVLSPSLCSQLTGFKEGGSVQI